MVRLNAHRDPISPLWFCTTHQLIRADFSSWISALRWNVESVSFIAWSMTQQLWHALERWKHIERQEWSHSLMHCTQIEPETEKQRTKVMCVSTSLAAYVHKFRDQLQQVSILDSHLTARPTISIPFRNQVKREIPRRTAEINCPSCRRKCLK
jgi:hypothetical protein